MKTGDIVYRHGPDRHFCQERDGYIILPTFYHVYRETKASAFLRRLESVKTTDGYAVKMEDTGGVISHLGDDLKVKKDAKEYVRYSDPSIPALFKPKVTVIDL